MTKDNASSSILHLPDQEQLSEIDAQAIDWVIKLDSGRLKARDKRKLSNWLNANVAHKDALLKWASVWDGADDFFTHVSKHVRDALAPCQSASRASSFLQKRRLVLSGLVAAFALVAIGPQAVRVLAPQSDSPTLFATNVGEQRTLTLEDGSTIQMNTKTVVEVDYSDTQRTISMLEGEAYYDVAHDPDRPFVIHVRDKVVRAVGTAFSVRALDDEVSVIVVEGAVELGDVLQHFKAPDAPLLPQPVRIEPLEKVTVKKGSPLLLDVVQTPELDRQLAWKQGFIVFEDAPLHSIVDEVSRYTNMKINIPDPELQQLSVGGRFEIGAVDSLIEALDVTFGVKAVYRGENQMDLVRLEEKK